MRPGWAAGVLVLLAGCVPNEREQRVRAYNEDGVHLFGQGDYVHARDTFQGALALTPEDANLHFNLGQCYDRLGRAELAEQSYRACLQRAPNHPECRHALCVLLVRRGRRDEAVRLVEDWLKTQPRLAAAYAEDAWLWHQAGDLPQAQSRLQQALDLDPHDPRALTEMGLVYEALGYPDRALVAYERCLDVRPNQPELVRRVNELRARGVGPPRPN